MGTRLIFTLEGVVVSQRPYVNYGNQIFTVIDVEVKEFNTEDETLLQVQSKFRKEYGSNPRMMKKGNY